MLKFFTFLVFLISFNHVQSKDNNNRLSVGVGIFNYMEDGTPPHNDQSQMMNLEVHSGKKMFNLIKPFAGFLYTNENTYYAYGGFAIDGYYGKKKNVVLTPVVACGYYNSGHEIKAGNPLEFYIGIDLFYRFRNNARLGFGIFHISNADSGYRNPGSETLILKYQMPIN
tara:strand:- start:690 stop:1196 length:507 start_codon:yes stop_codon:yes gene_type:complete